MNAQQILTGQMLHRIFEQQARGGSFTVAYRDGEIQHYGEGEPQFAIHFRDDNILDLVQGDMLIRSGQRLLQPLARRVVDLFDAREI
jgi:hypothetical protein